MKYKINNLGFNSSLNEYIYSKLDLITEALEDEVRNHPDLSHIKNCSFTINEEDGSLLINLLLRSNEKITKIFNIETPDLSVSIDFLSSFFDEEKIASLSKVVEEFGENLPASFLGNREPDLFNQLKLSQLIDSAPNQYEGRNLSDSQITFIKEISQNLY